MYHCQDCLSDFTFATVKMAKVTVDGVYRRQLLCPFCNGTNFVQIRGGYCQCCGRKLSLPGRRYCSETCRKNGEKMWQKQEEELLKKQSDPLRNAMQEVDAYNKGHKSRLSYGQYFAMKGVGAL